MNDILDKAFDILLYSTIGACFISALLLITNVTIDTLNGWTGLTSEIWMAAGLIAIGMAVSAFLLIINYIASK